MPGHYDTGAAPARTSQSSQYLEVEQRCYLIIVAIFLAQAVLAWPFVHGYCGDAQLALSVERSLDPPSLLIRTHLDGNEGSLEGPPEGLTERGRPHAAANVWESR